MLTASERGLQPPSGSLVCLYNKIIGVTSVLVSSLVLLGSLTRVWASGSTDKRGQAGAPRPVEAAPAAWVPAGPRVPWRAGTSVPASVCRGRPVLTWHGHQSAVGDGKPKGLELHHPALGLRPLEGSCRGCEAPSGVLALSCSRRPSRLGSCWTPGGTTPPGPRLWSPP